MPSPILPKPIDQPVLLIGEGGGDETYFSELCAARGIGGISFESAGGKGGYRNALDGLRSRRGFHLLKGVILVGDNDEGPDEAFRNLQRQVKDSKIIQYPPTAALLVAPADDQSLLRLAILTVPLAEDQSAQRGALETILLRCLSGELTKYARCANEFVECAAPDGGDQSHLDKVRMRTLLAAAHPEEPNITLSKAIKAKRNLFDYQNPCHDVVVEAIRAIVADMLR